MVDLGPWQGAAAETVVILAAYSVSHLLGPTPLSYTIPVCTLPSPEKTSLQGTPTNPTRLEDLGLHCPLEELVQL